MRQRIWSLLMGTYSPAWRRRYGDELADLLATTAITPRSVTDVVASGLRQRMHGARLAAQGGFFVTIGVGWRHPTAFAIGAAGLLLPTFLIVCASILGYELRMEGIRAAIEPIVIAIGRWRFIDLMLVAAPPLAFVAAVSPLLRLGFVRRDGGLEAVIAVRPRTANMVIGLAALVVAGALTWHIVVESVLQVGG